MTEVQSANQQGNDHSLASILGYILSNEGLEQNLDLALNMSDGGEIPLDLLIRNKNVKKKTESLQELVEVL